MHLPRLRRRRTTPPGRGGLRGKAAPAVSGVSPEGLAVEVRPEGLVLFLTSTCLACRDVWSALSAGAGERLAGGPPVVVVTPDPTLEDRRLVAELAPPGLQVVMSTPAWQGYRAGPAPWVVLVSDAVVVVEGSADGWGGVTSLVRGRR